MDFTGKVALFTGGGNGIGRRLHRLCRAWRQGVVVDRDGRPPRRPRASSARTAETRWPSPPTSRSPRTVKAYVKAPLDTYGRIDCFFQQRRHRGHARADRRVRRGDV
jgi:NAD(P)-dependent dehydrogenase (short-subunit alcohol dehydrogenase family)